ncbi:hypothetical protein MFLO_08817 [Listeria floridensis FSL S10-1187]|uniref:DUF3995 domain-containing protein n=1 Tax=Listeria floridensis FSL S10-1187 TaxID=1265817 RepID=A0ABP3AXU9_9LIST|nr:DUF3995 domain-containing protein [Listeria floridensis]EUJ31519.1 hypothetical protein MFLO_08817 [Listeria floridensis FSL S10-1187]
MTIIFFWLPLSIIILIAILHLYWGFGGTYMIRNVLPEYQSEMKPQLFNRSPGLIVCLFVTILLFGLAFMMTVEQFHPGHFLVRFGLHLAVILLFLRLIGDFNAIGLFKRERHTRFAKFDNLIYMPICLFLAVSILFELYIKA